MAAPAHPRTPRPDAFSLFLVIKFAVFATGFWTWLVILAVAGGEASARHVLAAAGASTSTVVAVLLAVRMAVHRDVAERHADVRRLLVDISWNAFAAAGNAGHPLDAPANGFDAPGNGIVVPFPSTVHEADDDYDVPAASARPSGRHDDGGRRPRR